MKNSYFDANFELLGCVIFKWSPKITICPTHEQQNCNKRPWIFIAIFQVIHEIINTWYKTMADLRIGKISPTSRLYASFFWSNQAFAWWVFSIIFKEFYSIYFKWVHQWIIDISASKYLADNIWMGSYNANSNTIL